MNEWLRAALLAVVIEYLDADGLRCDINAPVEVEHERGHEWIFTLVEKPLDPTKTTPFEEQHTTRVTLFIQPNGAIEITRCERLPPSDPFA